MKLKLFLAVLFVFAFVPCVYGQVLEEERMEVFEAIRAAEEAGADVRGLVDDFNIALDLIETGSPVNVSAANVIFGEIVAESETLAAQATRQGNVDASVAIVKVVLLLGAAVVVWMRGDRWFWRLWRLIKEGYVVE